MDTFKENGISSTNFRFWEEGLIADINITNNHDFLERAVSMGIVPGEKIEILSLIPGVLTVKIKNKKFALDENIAKNIKVLEYGK
jgi:Fe2+ transport system protein FeoA